VWCANEEAEDVSDLDEEAMQQLVAHLSLTGLKSRKLLAALKEAAGASAQGSGPSSPSPPPPAAPAAEEKFYARDLILGQAEEAAGSLRETLGLNTEEFSAKLALGEKAIEMEFEAHGSDEDKANLHYVLHCKAAGMETMPEHLKAQIQSRKYHGGVLNVGELDQGHEGMSLGDFVVHEKAQIANLDRCETLAMRMYTSSSYPCFNRPLREQTRPHPFAMSVYHLAEGVRKMRKVAAKLDPAEWNKPVELWRGMADMRLDTDAFMANGGSERALMSTSRSKGVAQQYAASKCPLIFKYITRALGRGVAIDFLSIYPKEKEYLYPPLTCAYSRSPHAVLCSRRRLWPRPLPCTSMHRGGRRAQS
jgi:hypothetical protein